MTAYIIRRLLLIFPTLIGIMLLNFVIVQLAPGGPIETVLAKLQGTAVSATARVEGSGSELQDTSQADSGSSTGLDPNRRSTQGLDP